MERAVINEPTPYFVSEEPRRCPRCESPKIASIIWGLVLLTPEEREELASGKIILGGCIVTGYDPSWRCAECGALIYDEYLRPYTKEILAHQSRFSENLDNESRQSG